MVLRFFPLFLLLIFLSGCAAVDPETAPLILKPASFSDLPGWKSDDQGETLEALEKSCRRILKQDAGKPYGPGTAGSFADWHAPCRALPQDRAPQTARAYFEQWFAPWQATMAGTEDEGLFTGYYEAALNGSRTRHGPYRHPLMRRPSDLVTIDLGEFREELRGQRIAGRVRSGALKPYEDRAAIESGALDSESLALAWVDDPVDSFFLHIQGSGRVDLDDGSHMRVGYDAQNGHVYYAIGRELIKRGDLSKDDVSMQSIRKWLQSHPDQARDLMNTNRSYIFFREMDDSGPQGGEGVPLTAGRSLAIDRTRIAYGVPVWLDAELPDNGQDRLQRLMVAQDTGGAIRGAVRGDYYWGYGPQAEDMAGKMKSNGRMWLLLPRTVRPGQ